MAKETLRRQRILVTSLKQVEAKEAKGASLLTSDQLVLFTKELAQLLKAGLPLYESLLTIEEKYRRTKTHILFADLCDLLKGGLSLSSALARYPSTFHEIYLSMVRSAEQSGALPQIFEQLSLLLSKQQKLKKQLISSLAYPAFLGGFCLLVVGALFFFVIPSMKDLLEGRSLHPLTQTVLSLSNFLNEHVVLLFSSFALFGVGLYCLRLKESFRRQISQWILQMPYIKKICLQAAFVRFFRAMQMLLSGGIPLVEALGFSKKIVHHPVLSDLFSKVQQELIEGKKMSVLLSASSWIPPLVVRMVTIGEETGSMPSIMHHLAEIYEEELDKHLQQFSTFLQPAVLLFLGAVVGLVVLSILLPMTDVSSFASS